MSEELNKLAKAMRDMSDMVGDLHWMAAKAVEDLTKKDGEIAKRDAELAACRVAVENCDVFRARIAELTAELAESRKCAEIMQQGAFAYQAELAALKAQEPVAWSYKERVWAAGLGGSVWRDKLETNRPNHDECEVKDVVALYTTPVAKQLVMPELIEKLRAIAIRERMFRIEETYTAPEISDSISLLNNEIDEISSLNAADQEGGQHE